jgi:phospholipid/cholesterol/gamma-HCH transport system substrate-binding protein
MEIRARYTLMGLFTLAVIAAGFAFVYWLNTAGGFGARSPYRIRYDGTVSGLIKGSSVLFNGIRVGEVTNLIIDPAAPAGVTVEVAIEDRAPVRADTKAGIEFQGLAGAPVVALSGGDPAAAALPKDTKEPPLLIAEKNAGLGMTQAARDTLRHIDEAVTSNSEPLHSVIANIDKFSGALARNSDKVDAIVAGLEKFTGAGKPPMRTFDLTAATAFPGVKKIPQGQLYVTEPSFVSGLDNDKLQVRSGPSEKQNIEGAQWSDMLTKVIQARLVDSFENAQYLNALGHLPDGGHFDYQLAIDVRNFQIMKGVPSQAAVELAVKIMTPDGKIVASKIFSASIPVETIAPDTAANALAKAFEKVAGEIVTWTCAAI